MLNRISLMALWAKLVFVALNSLKNNQNSYAFSTEILQEISKRCKIWQNKNLKKVQVKIADAIVACTFETYFSFASKELLRLKTGVFRNEKSPRFLLNFVWTSQGLNLGPPDYESVALTN